MPGDAPMLFSGLADCPGPEFFAKVRESWPPEWKFWRALYKKFMEDPKHEGLYPDLDAKGATIGQIWNYSTLWGRDTYCFLARTAAFQQTELIRRLERCSPEDLLGYLKQIGEQYNEMFITALVSDGKFGHCVYLRKFARDRDRFIYHDPWPARSLLCKESNIAGVAAEPESLPDGELGLIDRWSITSADLKKVIVASIVPLVYWAFLKGFEYKVDYYKWKDSDFFHFFHVRLLKEEAKDGITEHWFTTGPFGNSVVIVVGSLEDGTIDNAKLFIDRIWLTQHLIMVIDLVQSFIVAFTPAPDTGCYDKLCENLPRVTDSSFLSSILQRDDSQMLLAFMGLRERADESTDFTNFRIENIVRGDRSFLKLAFDLA